MKRFYIEKIEDIIYLVEDNHRHLSLVLRAKIGDCVILFNGDGFDYFYEITEFSKKNTKLQLVKKQINDCEPNINVTLFMGALKGDKTDFVVQKATELGISEINVFLSQYTSVNKNSIKTDRLTKIAIEACKQCKRSVIPTINFLEEFSLVQNKLSNYNEIVFLYENADNKSLNDYIKSGVLQNNNNIAIIIGSEGGFSKDEVAMLSDIGIGSLSLGKRILRAETAAITAMAIILNEAGQLS